MNLTNFDITFSAALPTRNANSILSTTSSPAGLQSVITNNLKPFVMKTNILKTLSLILVMTCFGKANAHSDLFAMNTAPTAVNVAVLYKSDDKVVISDFKRISAADSNAPVVTVKAENSISMQVRIFTLNGDLAKEETHAVENGVNDVKVDMSDLTQGVYMVQFYTKEGSALRRFVKNN
jgi:hypothetical protein